MVEKKRPSAKSKPTPEPSAPSPNDRNDRKPAAVKPAAEKLAPAKLAPETLAPEKPAAPAPPAAPPAAPKASERTRASKTTAPKPALKAPAPKTQRPKAAKPVAEKKPPVARDGATKPAAEAVPAPSDPPLSIVMISSEAHPFAKTGGLAEVVGSLPDALARLGHTVTIIVPRYRDVDARGAAPQHATIWLGGRQQDVAFYKVPLNPGVTAVLIDAPELFDRDGIYGVNNTEYADNGWRFAVLSRAALEYIRLSEERPSIIHAHDWQTGLVPVFQKMHLSQDPIVGGVPVVFTIHNLAFQGVFPTAILPALDLGWEVLSLDAMEFWGQVSYLKAGVNFSEQVTTVSPSYAREILTSDGGAGFDGILRRRAADLTGILNGIDVGRWNPEADAYVPASFNADDLTGKAEAKRALLASRGLPADEDALRRPVVGIISRMTDQKGFDLMESAMDGLMSAEATWVVLGSGDAHHEQTWRGLAAERPTRVATTIGFDERLAHLIEAGADMFLMPSRWEPCGLNQMYSLRYGTVPVVRATGGLEDTVRDPEEGDGPATGFKFRNYVAGELTQALHRAVDAFRNSDRWHDIQRAGMREDHSWDASAREYVKVYRNA